MWHLLRALLRPKLFRPTFYNLSFTRTNQTGWGHSGPASTEPVVGEYRPLTSGWTDRPDEMIPGEVDIAIIGGGLVGLCTALFLKNKFPRSFSIALIEKDPLVRFLHHDLCSVFCSCILFACTNYPLIMQFIVEVISG